MGGCWTISAVFGYLVTIEPIQTDGEKEGDEEEEENETIDAPLDEERRNLGQATSMDLLGQCLS